MADGPKLSNKTSFYLDPEKIRKLKSRLALVGKSISGWMREQIDKFLEKGDKQDAKKKENGSEESNNPDIDSDRTA